MSDESALIVAIRVQKLDGYFYAASPDVPGLHVCGESVEQTLVSAQRAVKALFKTNRRLEVTVMQASEDVESFPRMTGPVDRFVVQQAS